MLACDHHGHGCRLFHCCHLLRLHPQPCGDVEFVMVVPVVAVLVPRPPAPAPAPAPAAPPCRASSLPMVPPPLTTTTVMPEYRSLYLHSRASCDPPIPGPEVQGGQDEGRHGRR